MASRVRISAISFLNTAPLMWDFEHGGLRRDFDVTYTVPAACAEQLRLGTADVGIIPIIAYHTIPDLRVVPGVSISASGPVRSILLISKVPVEEIRKVAADSASRTSVALNRVLFRKYWGGKREFIAMEPDLDLMLQAADAALIIGDPALTADRSRYICYDLAEEWTRLTGKPFVFAFWAVRAAALARRRLDLARVFQASRDHGLQHVDDIARAWAPRVGLSQADVRSYLTENIEYDLDEEKLAGMNLFLEYALETGVLAGTRPLEFLATSGKAV